MNRPRISLVAAVARNGVIGRAGKLPWGHFPEDMAHFRALTMGAAVVMGHDTWDSLPDAVRPLPRRRNVVLSRDDRWMAEGAAVAGSMPAALELLRSEPVVYVIGGASVYELALHMADEVVLTEIDRDFDGDVRFPIWSKWRFNEVDRQQHRAAAMNNFQFSIVTYRREHRHWSDAIYWRPGRWDDLSTAPKDCTMVRGINKDGGILEPMHYACGGGEEQPAFDGWFLPNSSGRGFYEVSPVAWQPLRALPKGPDCGACKKPWAECCGKKEAA